MRGDAIFWLRLEQVAHGTEVEEVHGDCRMDHKRKVARAPYKEINTQN